MATLILETSNAEQTKMFKSLAELLNISFSISNSKVRKNAVEKSLEEIKKGKVYRAKNMKDLMNKLES